MPRREVIHLEVVDTRPSESDPDGWSDIACGDYPNAKASERPSEVTCKRCLAIIKRKEEK